MSEAESKVLAIREVYGAYFHEMGGTGAAPEQAARNAIGRQCRKISEVT